MDLHVAPLARVQHGLVTRAQLLTEISARQIERAVERGRLERLTCGVFRVAGAPDTFEQRVLAACLTAGPTARASFGCAAALWGIRDFAPGRVELSVDRTRRARIPGVVVRQSAIPDDIAVVRGVPTASVARTLCDLTATLRPWMVEQAVDDCLRRGLLTLDDLVTAHTVVSVRGRRKSTVMREILEWRTEGGLRSGDSAPEVRVGKLLATSGLPQPTQQFELRAGGRRIRIDLAYPAARLAIEYDGWEFHSTRAAFDRDRARANELELLGWTVLRFTSRSTDEAIVRSVRQALARSGDGAPPPAVGFRHPFGGDGGSTAASRSA